MSGRLLLVVGRSGSGKDTCLDWVLRHAPDRWPLLRATRAITRPRGPGEDHIPLSEADFDRRLALGLFALHWQAHGLRYGIGCEIERWLAAGAVVLVSGSRAAVPACCTAFPTALVVHLQVDDQRLAQRIRQRGREQGAAIDQRLARLPDWRPPAGVDCVTIANDGTLAEAGAALLDLCGAVLDGIAADPTAP